MFFFISLTFPCICEAAKDSLTGMLSDRRCLFDRGATVFLFFPQNSQCVRVRVCWSLCRKVGVLSGRDRHTLHVLLKTGAPGRALVHDSCLSLLSSLHLTPDRLSPHPLPPHLCLRFPPTRFPPHLTSSHGATLGRSEWWTAKAGECIALSMGWCGAAGLSQAKRCQALETQNELRTQSHT